MDQDILPLPSSLERPRLKPKRFFRWLKELKRSGWKRSPSAFADDHEIRLQKAPNGRRLCPLIALREHWKGNQLDMRETFLAGDMFSDQKCISLIQHAIRGGSLSALERHYRERIEEIFPLALAVSSPPPKEAVEVRRHAAQTKKDPALCAA